MQPRKMILGVLVGGPMLGMVLGWAANPQIAALPEPAWRSAQPDAIFQHAQRLVDAGPQDLSPRWDSTRVPTWKRDAAARQVAERTAMEDAAYRREDLVALAPATEAESLAGLHESAADRAPASEAQVAVPVIVPAAIEPDEAVAGG